MIWLGRGLMLLSAWWVASLVAASTRVGMIAWRAGYAIGFASGTVRERDRQGTPRDAP